MASLAPQAEHLAGEIHIPHPEAYDLTPPQPGVAHQEQDNVVPGLCLGQRQHTVDQLCAVIRRQATGDSYREDKPLTSPGVKSLEHCPIETQGRGLEPIFPEPGQKAARGLQRRRIAPERFLVLKKNTPIPVGAPGRDCPGKKPYLLISGQLPLERMTEFVTLLGPSPGSESGHLCHRRGIRMPPREFESLFSA